MTTTDRSLCLALAKRSREVVPLMAAAVFLLPVPIPAPVVNAPTTAAITVLPPIPSPPVPSVLPTQAPPSLATPVSNAGAAQPRPAPTTQPAAGSGGGPHHGVTIPFTTIYVASPLDVALIGALSVLPLLFGLWLLLFGRTFVEARRAREAQTRLLLAGDIGLRPRDLMSMSTKALYDLREKAAFDELTGVLRRVAGIAAAEREIARARRRNAPLSVTFLDADGLKQTNDRKGHAAGDALLRGLAGALKDGLRGEDVVFRYGGDEFVCILPDTSARAARERLGEIQTAAARSRIRFSFGVAQLARSDDVVSLFARADGALYEFKTNRGEIVLLPPRGARKKAGRSLTG